MAGNKNIRVLLGESDAVFETAADATQLRLLQAYKKSLRQVQDALAKLFENSPQPTIVEARRANRLTSIERQMAAAVRQINGQSVNITSEATRKRYVSAYAETTSALEMGSGINMTFSELSQKAIEYAAADTAWLDAIGANSAKLLSDSKRAFEVALRTNARQDVIAGISQGQSYRTVSQAIQDNFNVAATRARTITSTEMHKAHSRGRLEGIDEGMRSAKKLGLAGEKIWKHNNVGVPRPEHVAADGQAADSRGLFHVGGEALEAPGLGADPSNNINCHCSAQFEIRGLRDDASRISDAEKSVSSSKFSFTEDGKKAVEKMAGNERKVAEAFLSGDGTVTGTLGGLQEGWTTSKDPKTIVSWYFSHWKKNGIFLKEGQAPVSVAARAARPIAARAAGEVAFATRDEAVSFFGREHAMRVYAGSLEEGKTVDLLERTNALIAEMKRNFVLLQDAFKRGHPLQLDLVNVDTIRYAGQRQSGGTLGTYSHSRNELKVAAGQGRRWTSGEAPHLGPGHFKVGSDSIQNTVAHELGHRVNYLYETFSDGRGETWYMLYARLLRENSLYFARNVSKYAGTNQREAFAEAFAAYTHPRYSEARRKLPGAVEAYFKDLLSSRGG